MSDPYETTPYETTEEQLGRLLGRALNSFDLPDALVERLGGAIAHSSSCSSAQHTPDGERLRRTHRHTYLLADGSSLSLWELEHRRPGPGGETVHEVFANIAELARAGRRSAGFDPLPGVDHDPVEEGPRDAAGLFAASGGREYRVEESADHARRVLRRAENPDRPGARTAERLRSAFAHTITQAFGPRAPRGEGREIAVRLYEHAFVLLDGTELSLWEVEHTATPDGRHMCEVYETESAARGAMELRVR
ncbi:DUF6227 family protein [Streptomyces sp. BI20]|uniref:DUF6227 family protein n=1 Tax=Streptomyces sp. BI20 TaxID=3403460 RepID=UPI003C740496